MFMERKAYQFGKSPVSVCQVGLAWIIEWKTTTYPWGSHSSSGCVDVAIETR